MGRFDDLLKLDRNPPSPAPAPASGSQTGTQDAFPPPAREQPAPASLQVNQQTRKQENQQTSKHESKKTSFPAPQPETTKEKKKYGTYLREDSIEQIQICAIQTKRKDHEVLQEAIDRYFAAQKK